MQAIQLASVYEHLKHCFWDKTNPVPHDVHVEVELHYVDVSQVDEAAFNVEPE